MAGTVTYSIGKKDYVTAGRVTFIRGLQQPRFRARLALITAIGLVAGYALNWRIEASSAAMFAGVGALYGLLFVLVVMSSTYMLLPRRLGRLFDQQKSLIGEQEFAWSNDGTVLISSRGTTRLGWSDYHDWRQARQVFIFYLNDQLFHLVPKRAMSAEQCADLLAIASRELGAQG